MPKPKLTKREIERRDAFSSRFRQRLRDEMKSRKLDLHALHARLRRAGLDCELATVWGWMYSAMPPPANLPFFGAALGIDYRELLPLPEKMESVS